MMKVRAVSLTPIESHILWLSLNYGHHTMKPPLPIPQVTEFPPHLVKAFRDGKTLGIGLYATVKQHPKRKHEVIKLANDGAYASWLGYVLANQHNPYFPKVYEAIQTPSGDIMVRMEKLRPLADLNEYDPEDTPQFRTMNRIEKATGAGEWRTMDKPDLVYSSRYQMELVSALSAVFAKHCNDMHYGNGMVRGNHLVITDPVS